MSAFTRLAILITIALAAAALTGWLHPRPPVLDREAVEEITVGSAVEIDSARVLWVDARSRDAFSRRHIPGAVLLNEDEWDRALAGFVEAWQPGQRVIVYCDSSKCHASTSVARRLKRELGITPVQVLKGGWESWLSAMDAKAVRSQESGARK